MKALKDRFAEDVFKRRHEMGLSQEAFAKLTHIGLATLKRIEAATHEARLDTIEKIAKALRIAPKELLA